MTKMDHQHRLRGLNWHFPRVLVNLYFQQDLIRKPLRRTYSSKQITFICNRTNVGRLWKTPEDKPHVSDMWGRLAPPASRLAYGPHLSSPLSNDGSPLSQGSNLRHCFKSVWSKGLGLTYLPIYTSLYPSSWEGFWVLKFKNPNSYPYEDQS
jgi:hypothetical protein